jgi:ABC-2 type transport system permease protein
MTITQTAVMARRNLLHVLADPQQMIGMSVQPLMFLLLFVYVFGGAISGSTRGYLQFVLPGLLVQGIAFGTTQTAVGLNADFQRGLIDRFRSLPISRAAVLVGRTMSDLATQVLGLVVLVATGLAVGWRMERGIGDALLAAGLSLLIAFAMTWVGACAGMLLRSPETAQALGFIFFLPLSFVSNAFVPTQGMPAWLRDFANWNPLSAIAASCRNLFGGNVPTPDAWPMQHPELAVVIWSVGLIVVFAPTAVYLYRRKVLR